MPGPSRDRDAVSIRSGYAWALAVVAAPWLVLFGAGFFTDTDIEGSMRVPIGVLYFTAAWVIPALYARRSMAQGAGRAIAVVKAVAVAVLALFLFLVIAATAGFSPAGLVAACFATMVSGVVSALALRSRRSVPPRPDIGWTP